MTLESDVRDVLSKHVEPIIKDILALFETASPPPPLPVEPPGAVTTPQVPAVNPDAPPHTEPLADPNAHVEAPSGAVVETSGTAETTTGDVNKPVDAPTGNVIDNVGAVVEDVSKTTSDAEKVVDFVKGLAPEALAALKEALKVV